MLLRAVGMTEPLFGGCAIRRLELNARLQTSLSLGLGTPLFERYNFPCALNKSYRPSQGHSFLHDSVADVPVEAILLDDVDLKMQEVFQVYRHAGNVK